MFHFFSHHQLIEGDYDISQIVIEEELGRGNSHVFTAVIKGQLFAIKQIQIKDDYEYRSFLKQISFMKQLSSQSQSMIKYHGYFITKMQIDQYLKHKYAFIIMECAEMNLQHLVAQYRTKNLRFSLLHLQQFIETVLNALCELEAKQIAHCDIKPQNILIMNSNDYKIKLCDVGSCKIIVQQNFEEATILGTVPFLAPQLIKIKSKKIVSTNPFKSDVFSFGLVFLYLITFKKFKSQERIETEQVTYKQIIYEWMKQAKEIINFDFPICQMLRLSLEFDQYKRPLFNELRYFYIAQKNKKYSIKNKELQDLQKQQDQKLMAKGQLLTSFYQSSPGNFINLFKSRKLQKSSIKTSGNGASFRITTTNSNIFKGNKNGRDSPLSPSPLKKRSSVISSNSPDKNMNFACFDIKKLIYINKSTKQFIEEIIDEEEKTFVLEIPFVPFKRAESVSVLPECGLEVLYMLQNVQANKLYLEYQNVQSIGFDQQNTPSLNFCKIRVNLIKSSFVGGYSGLFKSFVNSNLQALQLRITQSQVTYNQIIQLLDRLAECCPKLNFLLLCWQKNILLPDDHFQLTQKLAKLNLKKLYLVMNENYIKYDKQMTWVLPKNCQVLYLQYSHNLLNSIINNLSLSMASLIYLKQLYLNFENNNLLKGEINMISKSVLQLKNLQKIILDLSLNKIEDLNYLQKNLSQHINLNVIQIRLHRTQTSIQRTIIFIKSLKELFQFKLKILKVTVNRHISSKLLKDKIQSFCVQKGVRKIICDVIGFDNNYFMIYLKKKPKPFVRGHKGTTSVRKDKFQMTSKLTNNISLGGSIIGSMMGGSTMGTTSGFHPLKSTFDMISLKSTGICTRLFTMADGYDNYMCLGCCQSKQTSKFSFYCKFCIQHCFHKGHNIVKIYQRTKCSCSHSGQCLSDVSQNICSETLKIYYKRKFECTKCIGYYCLNCISSCKQLHKSFIIQYKELTYFTCSSKPKAIQL